MQYEYDPPMYTMTKAIVYRRKILDTSQLKKKERAYDNIIMTSQTSSLNLTIKHGKQLIIPVTNRRQ